MGLRDEIVMIEDGGAVIVTVRPLRTVWHPFLLATALIATVAILSIMFRAVYGTPTVQMILFGVGFLLVGIIFIYIFIMEWFWSIFGGEKWVFARNTINLSRFLGKRQIGIENLDSNEVRGVGIVERKTRNRGQVPVSMWGFEVVLTNSKVKSWGRFSIEDAENINSSLTESLQKMGYSLAQDASSTLPWR